MGDRLDTAELARQTRYFFNEEYLHCRIYGELAAKEKNGHLKRILGRLSEDEKRHMRFWEGISGTYLHRQISVSALTRAKVRVFMLLRNAFSIAFVNRLMERNERAVLGRYGCILSAGLLKERDATRIRAIMSDEASHGKRLGGDVASYEENINHIRSVILGLNDGIVEVMAAIAGFAVLAQSHLTVVLVGAILGISGTLSMAGGAYLSSKSEMLLDGNSGSDENGRSPLSEAMYTGLYYLSGAIIVVAPFIFGFSGFVGIGISILLAAIVLSIASTLVAVISRTSIVKRVFEMLAITLTASALTILLGLVLKTRFGVSI
jgi:VIT1/CCC1 family predicted Fe2+/Mn2+ transporter